MLPSKHHYGPLVARPPAVHGTRLGLVIGSSLPANPFPALARSTHDGVVVDDCGDFVVVLRHGAEGTVPAHLVDHHAHVRALCAAGCDRVLALGSGGGLRADLGPGTVLAPDDFLALTTYPTFHDTTDGYAMAGFDPTWRAKVVAAWPSPIVDGGTYAMVRGPRFETRAEIRVLATQADVVGMTIPAECILAGEAGLAYAAVCKVDNLANGVAGHDLTVDEYRDNVVADAASFTADVARALASLAG
ncbi:MAG: methylthioadenosine phosphorylase [Actinomycetia bacterium]|nr:methylthioadenosine phosphorylase [Actinomycetes bacterium]